jgi:predicted CXXCH cytochrome family protein
MGVSCFTCHGGAEKSRHAGIPSASTCMTCHKFIKNTKGAIVAEQELAKKEGRKPEQKVSPEIQKIYDALALNEKMERDPNKKPKPIEWVKVHNIPDFVYFDHRPHINAEVDCQKCHGAIESMERVRQVSSLSMGFCVKCHRDVKKNGLNGRKLSPSTDCSTCHY